MRPGGGCRGAKASQNLGVKEPFLAVSGPGRKAYWDTCAYLGRVCHSEFLLLVTRAPTSSPQEFAAEDTFGACNQGPQLTRTAEHGPESGRLSPHS